MLLWSLALTISTCLSGGCGQLSTANRVTAIKESAVEIVKQTIENFDYGYYDLSFSEQESFSKQKLLSYAEENQLFTVDVLEDLQTLIEKDPNFTYFEDVDELFIRKSNVNPRIINEKINNIGSKLNNDIRAISTLDKVAMDRDLIVTNNFSDIYFDVGETGGPSNSAGNNGSDSSNETEVEETPETSNEDEIFKLPTVPCDTNKISTSTNGKVNEVDFFGLLCSKDACANLYNTFAGWINKRAMYQSGNGITPFKIITEAFKELSFIASTTIIGAAVVTKINTLIATITGAVSGIWTAFASLFTAGGPIGILIGLVVVLLGAACIGTIVAMIVYGYLGKGFAIGWKMHTIWVWDWEWFCGDIY